MGEKRDIPLIINFQLEKMFILCDFKARFEDKKYGEESRTNERKDSEEIRGRRTEEVREKGQKKEEVGKREGRKCE